MSEQPLVTIITPSLNSGAYIGETIESVLAQTYSPIEFRVLDGGSTDNTHDVLRSFGDRVDWVAQPDNGQSEAINRGWRAARGEIIAWLCADDLLEPDAVETAVDVLTRRPDAAAVYGAAAELFPDGSETLQPLVPPFNLWRLINFQDFIYQPATFFRRDAVEAVGWLDESLHYGMDWDLLIRLGERYPLIPIQDRMARVRIYPETKTSGGGNRRFRELVRIMRWRADGSRPPVYWYYLLETYRNRAHQRFDKLTRDPRTRRRGHFVIERCFVEALRLAGRRIATEWLDDGWAGPSAHFLVPAGRAVSFHGEVPVDLAPITLTVSSRGRELMRQTLGAGPFQLTAPLPNGSGTDPARLLVEASRAKPVDHHYLTGRRGSYLLDGVEVSR